MTTMRIEGGEKLARKMRFIDDDVRKRIGRAATRDAAKVVRVETENSAPPRTTAPIHIADSIRVRVASKEETRYSWVYYVNISSKAFYWYFYEFGTSRQPARPFFRPAFEKSYKEALGAMVKRLRARLAKV